MREPSEQPRLTDAAPAVERERVGFRALLPVLQTDKILVAIDEPRQRREYERLH
jgi:hypothetical protein